MLQDKTKLISSLALLLVGSSVFYYLVIFLPKQAQIKSSQELYERQLDCAKAGTKYMDELKQIRSRSYFTGSYFVKKISYNDELKTCLVRYDDGPYFGTKESEVWVSRIIDDVYSKQLVISSSDPSKDGKLEEFRQKELELFGTNY